MKAKNNKKILSKNCKGVTLTDVVIAITIIALFTGTVATLMYNTYVQSIAIQKGASANAYATIILEKIDEKSYDSLTVGNPNTSFVQGLLNSGEFQVKTEDRNYFLNNYATTLVVTEESNHLIKDVRLTITYSVAGNEKQIAFTKKKVKEIENV